LSDIDLLVARCTTLLLDALVLGIPTIACLFTSFEQNLKMDFISPDTSVENITALETSVNYLEQTFERFYQFREVYINSNQLISSTKGSQIDLFIAKIDNIA